MDSAKIAHLTGHIKRTHQGFTSVKIMPKSMTYRDTAYLKISKVNLV